MGTVCQACGYERKPTDQAPDWECPSCGKAYVKTAHDSHDSISGSRSTAPSPSSSRPDEGSGYRQAPRRSAFDGTGRASNKYGALFGAALGILFVAGIPILRNPSSASAILLHGSAGLVCVFLLVAWGIVVLARRSSKHVDLNSPSSRFAFSAKFLALACSVFFIVPAIWLRAQEHTETKIQANGQRAMADVVRIYNGGCGKHSCSIDVEYAFTPTSGMSEGSQPIHGYGQLGTSDRPNDPNLVYANTNQHVPIAYEVDDPQVSALNFNDDVFRLDHGQRYRKTVGLLGAVFLGVFLVGLAVTGLIFRSNSRNQPNPQ
jgi:hypothetical protein